MRFKLDENLPVEILEDLRAAGHEGDSVHDEGLAGEPDTAVLAAAKREGRVLLIEVSIEAATATTAFLAPRRARSR